MVAATLVPAAIKAEDVADIADFKWSPASVPVPPHPVKFPVLLLDEHGKVIAEKVLAVDCLFTAAGMQFHMRGGPPYRIPFGEAPVGNWHVHSWGTYIGNLIGSDSKGIKTLGILDCTILEGNTLSLEFGTSMIALIG